MRFLRHIKPLLIGTALLLPYSVNELKAGMSEIYSPSVINSQNLLQHVSMSAEEEKASAFVSKMGDDAISFLSDASLSQAQKEKEFNKLLNRNFDMQTIGRFALGKNWKTATPAQQKEYLKLFEDMVVRVYSSRFNDYKGEAFKIDLLVRAAVRMSL